MSGWRRHLAATMRVVSLTLILLLIGLSTTVGWLVAGNGAISHLLPLLSPWLVVEGEVEGSLLNRLVVGRPRLYDQQGGRIALERLELEWHPIALLDGRLQIERLRLVEPQIELPAATPTSVADEPSSSPFPPPLPELPISVTVGAIEIDRLARLHGAGLPVLDEWLPLSATLSLQGERHQLSPIELDLTAPDAALHLRGEIDWQGVPRLALDIAWRLLDRHALAGVTNREFGGKLAVEGDLERIRLAKQLNLPVAVRADVVVDQPLQQPSWSAVLQMPETAPGMIEPSLPGERVSLMMTASGGVDQLQIESLELQLDDAHIGVSGQVANLGSEPTLDLAGEWEGLRWPLTGEQRIVESRTGRLEAAGPLSSLRASAELQLAGESLPVGSWQLTALRRGQGLVIEQLAAELLAGQLNASGEVDWSGEPQWRLDLTANGIDPGRHWLEWPGKLAVVLTAAGQGAVGLVQLKRLDGELRHYPLAASGAIPFSGSRVELQQVILSLGSNRLIANGGLPPEGEGEWQLDWQLDAPALAAIHPQLAGRLAGSGRVRGEAARPQVILELKGEEIAFDHWSLSSLSLAGEVESAQEMGDLRLTVDGLQQADQPLGRLALLLAGRREDHRIEWSYDGLLVNSGHLDGELDEQYQQWRGELSGLQTTYPGLPLVKQLDTASIDLSLSGQGALESLCLGGESLGRHCLSGSFEGGGWQASLNGDGLDVGSILTQAGMLNGQRLSGLVSLQFDAAGAGESLSANGGVAITSGEVALTGEGLEQFTLRHDDARLTLQLDRGVVAAGLDLRLGLAAMGEPDGELHATGQFGIAGAAPIPAADSPLTGQLSLNLPRLADLLVLAPQLNSSLSGVAGRLDAAVVVGGTLNAPAIEGKLALIDGAAELPMLGVSLSKLTFDAAAEEGGRITVDGQLSSGAGELQLAGGMDQIDPPRGSFTLRGERFKVIDTADAMATIAPDLQLMIDGSRLDLTGMIGLPEARITPRHLASGAVTPSSDVVESGAVDQPEPAPIDLHADLQLVIGGSGIGEGVMVDAAGFSGGLQGALRVVEGGSGLWLDGVLETVDGRYQLYGQELAIDRGRVRFPGGPVDALQLDLEAKREVGEAVATARVRGSMNKPTLTLASRPVMDQSDILAMLLFGRPANALQGSEGALVLQAVAGMVGGGGDTIGQIGQQIGLDVARIEASGDLDQPRLVLGKYLSPRLYLGYAADLFDVRQSVTLRYRINERWQIKSEAGAESGADIFYTLGE